MIWKQVLEWPRFVWIKFLSKNVFRVYVKLVKLADSVDFTVI